MLTLTLPFIIRDIPKTKWVLFCRNLSQLTYDLIAFIPGLRLSFRVEPGYSLVTWQNTRLLTSLRKRLLVVNVLNCTGYVYFWEAIICIRDLKDSKDVNDYEKEILSIRTLRSNNATVTRTSLKECLWVLSVFIAIIPTHLLRQK